MDKIYINILQQSLVKKNDLLDRLIYVSSLQEEYTNNMPPQMDEFEQTLVEKDLLIEQLNQIDDGFEKVYEHVQQDIKLNRNKYKEEILQLQDLIKQITEKSVKLQTLELKNKSKLELYFLNRKKEIKNLKISNQTAFSYYKNMSNQNHDESYFLDKKK